MSRPVPPSPLQSHCVVIHFFMIYCVLLVSENVVDTWLIKRNGTSLQEALESEGTESRVLSLLLTNFKFWKICITF